MPAQKPDPTKDPEFQKVIQAFLNTPPRRHAEEKIGKARVSRAKSPGARKRKSQGKKAD